ncbi:PH domain-containing protein [Actinomadura keratinilytica]
MLAVSLLLTATTWLSLIGALLVPGFLWFATHNLWTVLAAGVPLLGAAGATSAGRFVREYDWTLGESPDGLRLDHGLLDRSHETVPPGRVQTVRIVEPWLWRRLGWVRVELDVAARTTASCCRWPTTPPPARSSGASWPEPRYPGSSSGRRAARPGAYRPGGAGTASPSPTASSPPGTACSTAPSPSSRTPRCRVSA